MDLDIVMLNKSDTERQISYDITYMWNLKKNRKDFKVYCLTNFSFIGVLLFSPSDFG